MEMKHEIGALILRVVLGVIFLVHGVVKFQDGIENTAGWFSSIGLPGFMAYAVALLETIGGVALIVGLGIRIFSVLFALLMAGAILKVKLAAGFLGNGQQTGYEFDLALLAMTVYLALNGNKLYSLDQWISKRKAGNGNV
ncbi:DoxX family protein [Paludifilum halophilum]|uniref:Oxidoreductase n=1 Tax=Paludifilum halophilum TaxID=1642702 RepID=A0A235BC87_9BACL|nr:DoxX family protein [Paludifilum halophilum]OYD09891.1 oxidoreductase [Paludifilum halophilum]